MMVIGLLVSLGLVLHFVEGMLPVTAFIPGARLGLANIVTLMGLVLYGFWEGFEILILRIFLGALLAGSFMTAGFYLSMAGGLLGFLTMSISYRYFRDKFSLPGISVVGATFHNLGQIMMAYLIIANPGIFYYLPYLILISVPTGLGTGLATYLTLKYLPVKII
jgi:heptaprenyl diphosphate synthase